MYNDIVQQHCTSTLHTDIAQRHSTTTWHNDIVRHCTTTFHNDSVQRHSTTTMYINFQGNVTDESTINLLRQKTLVAFHRTMNKHKSPPNWKAVVLFSKLNNLFFGYFHPIETHFSKTKITNFRGDVNDVSAETTSLRGSCVASPFDMWWRAVLHSIPWCTIWQHHQWFCFSRYNR